MACTLGFLLEKEFKQFFRDPFLPKMAIVFPVIIMLVIPFVANLDFKNINISVIDYDNSPLSQRLIGKIDHSSYFILRSMPKDFGDAMTQMDEYGLDVILEIPKDFEKQFQNSQQPTLSIVANAVDASKAASGDGYLKQIVSSTISEYVEEQGYITPAPNIVVRNMYNTTENYRFFMIPALTVMLIIIVCGALPALNIVKEKENGTIEQINATPIGKITFTFSKLIPYWIMGLVILTIALIIAWLLYGLVPMGSLLIVYANAVLFIFTISAFGLIVSNFSSTMQQSMFIMFFFIMIFVLMSGLLTPVESMPEWAQTLTAFIPPRYFIEVMRAVYLKGSSFADTLPAFYRLGGLTVVLALIAIWSYRKRQ